jgi:putative DNA primase/helicase
MISSDIAGALGGARREGRGWRCHCPLHGGHSLVIKDGKDGRVLVTCWAGCNRLDVLAELRRRGLLPGGVGYRAQVKTFQRRSDDGSRTAHALKIYYGSHISAGTIVARYLASRGLVFNRWPSSLGFHQNCSRPRDDAGDLVPPQPAMVALVKHAEHGPIGVHCTYLRSDGNAKADLPKNEQRACFGRVAGGAVRFGEPRPCAWLVVGEGIESTLSAAMPAGLPAWAALSASGIEKLVLSSNATHVVIAADNDLNGRGQRAAHNAAARWLSEGRRVRIALPPPGSDFNDVLAGKVMAQVSGAHHVAV